MNKLTLLLAIITISLSTAMAQDFGVRAGVNVAKWVGDANDAVNPRTGFNAGIVADLNFYNNFFFRPGIMYSQKGGRFWNDIYTSENGVKEGHDFYYNQNYLEIPLYVVYKRELSNNLKLDFQTGMYFAFGINGKTIVEYKKSNDWNFEYDMFRTLGKDMIGTQARRFDFGWNFGLGVEFSKYYCGVGYDIGLMAIHDCPEFMATKYWAPHNGCLMINLGYYFLSL